MPAAFELTFLDAEGVVRTVSPEHPLPIAGGAGGTVNAEDIADATATGVALMTAEDAAAARTAIGAGTSNLEIGTTASTAKAGNYQPTWAQVQGKPSEFATSSDQIEDATAVGISVITAADAATARTAIGAGTSDLEIGTTASTAKAGNYQPTWAQVSNKPSTFAATPASVEDAVAAKAEIAALTEIADPTTATAEDVANAVNAVIAALKA